MAQDIVCAWRVGADLSKGNTMDEWSDFAPRTLSDGATIQLEVDDGAGGLLLRETVDGMLAREAALPYPGGGLSGGYLLVSPTERYVLVAMFSGQSEDGFELFERGTVLKRVFGQEYVAGEASSYAFSDDESVLIMAVPAACTDWWSPWKEGAVEAAGDGRVRFRFGEIRVFRVPSGERSVHRLWVTVPPGWEPDDDTYDPFLKPELGPEPSLALSMPWGRIKLAWPLPAEAVLDLGRTRGHGR